MAAWNVYRGDLRELRRTGVYTQVPGSNPQALRHCGLDRTFVEDPSDPLPGEAAHFLVTGVDVNGTETGLGPDGSGQPRPHHNSCP
jgi:hypothetical protein